jgi:hypothetical protein
MRTEFWRWNVLDSEHKKGQLSAMLLTELGCDDVQFIEAAQYHTPYTDFVLGKYES